MIISRSKEAKSALIRPIHKDPTMNNIFSKPIHVHYFTFIDASSRYYNLRLDRNSSHLTTFTCQIGSYRCTRLPFGANPAGDMF